ncbi:MAG: peptidylprolyl isomerase [Euryarchaeota archaeon]|nr:peptidylprolyl isomerase [Euryarchaeota archaeon]
MESKVEVKAPIKIQKGDFIRLNYVARIKDTGKLFDCTIEEIAKRELGEEVKGVQFKPTNLIVGARQVIEGLDVALEGVEVGQQKEVEIPPEKAFGLRDPKLVKIVSAKQFTGQGLKPKPGMRVTIDDRSARIQSVSGGRVIVDMNHELAGKTIKYEFKVEEKIENPVEQVRSLLEYYFPGAEAHQVEVKGSEVTIKLAETYKFDQRAIVGKQRFLWQIFRHIPTITKITFIEEHLKPEEKKEKIDLGSLVEGLPKAEDIKPI